ncbi:hypothetical protein BHM03_00029653 [Ensete ventricosum]|nr:hypothetical protein BHM03_00029653 [Ensete ventricosum]
MQTKINWVVCLVQEHTGAVLSELGSIASGTPDTGPALSVEEHTRPVLSGMEPIPSGIGAYRAVLSGMGPIPSGTQDVCWFSSTNFTIML